MRAFMHTANRLAASIFFFLHCAYSLFVVLGAFLITVNSLWIWAHVPAVLWAFSMNLADWTCPLTTWEQHFRLRANTTGLDGFIRHYLRPLLNAHGDPRRLEVAIGVSLLIWNALLYVVLLGRSI